MAPRQRWEDIAAACNALKRASSQKDRAAAIRDAQQLLADERRRAELHRWKLWGLLFSSLLHAIKADAQAYLLSAVDSAEKSQQGIAAALAPSYAPPSSSASAKRARKAVKAVAPPPLHGWSFLRNEFAALHTTDEPALHLDPIGRECLHQLAAFALAVVSRSRPNNAIESDIRTQAWQLLELLVRFRVYCGVLEMTLLEDALECALKLLEEEQAERKVMLSERRLKAPELAASAMVLQRIVAHSPYDLHHKVERVWSAVAAWLGQQQASDSAGTEISLLNALTELMHRHFDTCQQYVPDYGIDVWRYVQRTWKSNVSRIHVHRADFVAAFVEQYDQLLAIKSDRSPHRLRRELGGLLDILLSSEELQRVLHSSKIIRSGSASLIGLNEVEPAVVAFLTSSADIMYLHDRLFRAEMATASSAIDSEELSASASSMPSSHSRSISPSPSPTPSPMVSSRSPGKKRSRGSLVTMAWEVLIEQVQEVSQSSGSSMVKPSGPTSGPGSHRYLRFGKTRLLVGWLGILLAVLRRHGDFYCQERIGDVLSLMPILVGWLSEKEVDARVALTLQILFQLALLAKRNPELRSDLFEDHWGTVWTSLLRFDQPYVATTIDQLTNDQIGHLAHSVLGACAALQLVPLKTRVASERSVWRVFCQTPNGFTGDVQVQQATCKSIAPLKFLQCLLHQAPQRLDIIPDLRDVPTSDYTMFDESEGAIATKRNRTTMRDHLLGVIFQHIRSNLGSDQVDPSKWATNSHRREVFGVTYAQALAALVTAGAITIGFSGDDIDLLAQLSRIQRRHRHVVPPDLLGFGVHFVMQEWGLHWLNSSARSDSAFDPDTALPAIREFRASSLSTRAPEVFSERFVRLQVPWQLVHAAPLVNEQPVQVELRQGEMTLSVSNEVAEGVMRTISESFEQLLADVVNKLCALNGDVGCCLSLLNDAAMIGVTMSGLYAKLMSIDNRGAVAPSGLTGLISPLKSFLQLMADHFTAVVIDQARNQGATTMDSVVNILRQLNSIVLLLQGEKVVNDMRHPVADPVDFHFPSELRSSIRRVVAAVEASLELLVMDPDNEAIKDFSSSSSLSSLPMSGASAHANSHSLSSQLVSPSGIQASSLDEDFADLTGGAQQGDSKERTSVGDHRRLERARAILSLWSLRTIILLKKQSGLKAVRKYALWIGLTPDFLLAVASVLCGVPGSDSLIEFCKLIEHILSETSKQGALYGPTRRYGGFHKGLIRCDMLRVIQLCSMMYENRKWENGEEVPQQLISVARSALGESGAIHSGLNIRDTCVRDTWVLEVLFRLNADAFDDFVDVVARNLVDADVYVRMAAARCVQTLFYMYPDGGNQMFQDLLDWLRSLLPFEVAYREETDTRSRSMASRNRQQKKNPSSKHSDTTFCLHPSDQSVVSTLMVALYISGCSSPFVVPEVILTFVCLAKCDDIPVYSDITTSVIHLWLNEIGASYGYDDVNHLLDNHFGAVWSRYLASVVGGNYAGSLVMSDEVLDEFRGHVLLGEVDPNRVSALFRRNANVIMPTAVLYDAIEAAKSSGDFCFPLVEKIGASCLSSSVSTTEGQIPGDLRELVEEQLITDLFALAFVLPCSSCENSLDEVAQRMLATAEDKAASHGLNVSHLGHVVMKMARFAVLDICRAGDTPSELDVWDRAMKSMKEKYLDFDWSKMNVAELLSEFHELLVCFELNAPLMSRAVECFCQFVHEARDALDSQFVLQQLCLHVCFQALRQICGAERRLYRSSDDKPQNFGRISHRHHVSQAVRRLTFLIRELCDRFMKNTDMFGKYLSVVVRDIADVLVRSQSLERHPMADASAATGPPKPRIQDLWLDSDSRANIEWVMFAICNNLGTGLGKYIQELDAVPNGASACLDKLNSLLGSATLTIQQESASKPGRSLYGQAKQQIEQFIIRVERDGDRFYRPSPRGLGSAVAARGPSVNRYGSDNVVEHGISALSSSALAALLPSVRIVRETATATNGNEKTGDDTRESARMLLAQLSRTLLQLSSRVDANVTTQDNDGDLVSIADILGAIGTWSSNDLELSPGHDAKELNRLYQTSFHRNALHDMKVTFLTQFHESLLSYLSSLLFDRSIQSATGSFSTAYILRSVLSTIKKVLRITDGTTAIAKSKDTELKQLLEPFVHAPASNWSFGIDDANDGTSKLSVTQRNSKFRRQLEEKWASHDVKSFDEWVCTVVSCLAGVCKDTILRSCSSLSLCLPDLAVFLFPYVLWSLLKNDTLVTTINEGITAILSSSSADPRITQLLIHSTNFLRETEKAAFVESNGRSLPSVFPIPGQRAPVPVQQDPSRTSLNQAAYGCLVEVDLLDIAAAAVRVKMPYSAMQYVELWLEQQYGGVIPSLSSAAFAGWEIDDRARSILVEAFSFDDIDVDGIYGVNDSRTLMSQLVTYRCEGNYTKAIPIYDALLDNRFVNGLITDSLPLAEGLFEALNRLGYHHILRSHISSQMSGTQIGSTGAAQEAIERQYELAWKNLQWQSLSTGLSETPTADGTVSASTYRHNETIFHALRSLMHRDVSHVFSITGAGKQKVLQSLQLSTQGLESAKDSFQALWWLQCIHALESCGRIQFPRHEKDGAASPRGNVTKAFESWSVQALGKVPFDFAESLVSLEEALIHVTQPPRRDELLAASHLKLCQLSRMANRSAVAYRSQLKLQELHERGVLSLQDELRWKIERARLLWSQKETRSAIMIAKQLHREVVTHINEGDHSDDAQLRMFLVECLTTTGKWIASQRSENSQVIIEQYLRRATEIADSIGSAEHGEGGHVAKAHLALANYMAEMYNQVHGRVTSREWFAGKKVAEARQRELAECLAMNPEKQVENRSHIHALHKEVQYDFEERTKVEASVDEFLNGALRAYGKGLALSPGSELAVVFRVMSLWFSNSLKPSVNSVIQEIVESVPSYKFVPLSYQIISRIGSSPGGDVSARVSTDSSLFERVLSVLVVKLCEQHPHHALIQLIALKNSADVEGRGALEFRTNVGDAKSTGAKKYLDKVRKGKQRDLAESLDILSNAYIHLALFDTREWHKTGKKIPLSKVHVSTMNGSSHYSVPFDQCLRDRSRRAASGSNRPVMPAVLTISIAPRPDMDYSSVVRVSSFEPQFSITDSGIHRPKIIYCHGSDGRRYKQLVKGKDDTRQDLVIEQVFDTVNHFLRQDHETQKRRLRLRTYKVVPLSPIAGVLEWVDGTMAWGSYLVGRTTKRLSAHERYHPNEWKHTDCRMKLKNATDKLAAYKEIEANFTPVFHHFFLERYPDAAMWYRRRLAFVQSAAVTSIVGYILGIGDRHSQNILIHEETAELVHIDFGVVFDQGMALFTPETVPFRLTRDMVDGMGVSGCEGVFTRCCEATLQLLRKKSASVVTILEVFVHDPLYRWTLSPLKALRIQEEARIVSSRRDAAGSNHSSVTEDGTPTANGGGAGSNDAAARALIRVKQKLEGYEDPNGNALSIEGQVKQLISVAQDPHNLCALFPGWAPWL